MKVVGIDGSPYGPGKTAAAVQAILAGAAGRGAETEFLAHDHPEVVARIAAADAVVPAPRGAIRADPAGPRAG